IKFGCICEFVDPGQVDQQQPARIVGRRIQVIKIYRLTPVIGTHAHEVTLAAHYINQLELLEEGGDRRKAFADLRSCFDGDAERRCVVECETDERVPDWSLGEVGYVEVETDQVGQLDVPLLVADREIIPRPIIKVTYAGQMHMVSVADGSRHHRDF